MRYDNSEVKPKTKLDTLIEECTEDAYRDPRDGKVNNDSVGKILSNVKETANRRNIDLPDDNELDRRIRESIDKKGRKVDPSSDTIYP